MSIEPQLNSDSNPPKPTKNEKNSKIKAEQGKLVQLIDGFYSKAKLKIEKTLNKDNKKITLLCEEVFRALANHPKQELYQISRLNDSFFNEIMTITNTISDMLKSMESLVLKMGTQLNIIKQRALKKQEKGAEIEKQIVILRKIRFKKEKTSLAEKLKGIDTVNRKLIKFEENKNQNQSTYSLEIQGKRLESKIVKSTKIWFSSKSREYLLCLVQKSRNQGQLMLFNDKLQTIATFFKIASINLLNFVTVVQIQDYLFIINTHSIVRISLFNQDDQFQELSKRKIFRAESTSTQLILWAKDEQGIHYALFFTIELQLFHQQMLPLSLKSISHQFKLSSKSGYQSIYFISRTQSGVPELWVIVNQKIQLLSKEIGTIDEIIPFRENNRNEYVLLRRGGGFYKFTSESTSNKLLQIDTEKGQNIQKCSILGQHLYCLHQSGKYLLQCLFSLNEQPQNLSQ